MRRRVPRLGSSLRERADPAPQHLYPPIVQRHRSRGIPLADGLRRLRLVHAALAVRRAQVHADGGRRDADAVHHHLERDGVRRRAARAAHPHRVHHGARRRLDPRREHPRRDDADARGLLGAGHARGHRRRRGPRPPHHRRADHRVQQRAPLRAGRCRQPHWRPPVLRPHQETRFSYAAWAPSATLAYSVCA
ncbi:hypothetical protein PsYK624_156140 [Phanerochaete sordida]|uniref:Uncharacterized protein n=1 Tax=Phanerochaete sordida TaxID=48140 RepID=A0A9P3GTC5_9APHY|nr:hypothetical protein PsYK624_156140 [Phanerochaete sordida]